MEALNGVVLKSSSSARCYSYTHLGRLQLSATSKSSCLLSSQVSFRKGKWIPSYRGFMVRSGSDGFEDKGHLEYYSMGSPVCGERKKGKKGWNGIPVKKRMKLLKGLVKDLSTFSDLGFGFDLGCDDHNNNEGFVADDKSKIISQAAETLLEQLKQLRAEEEQMKKCNSKDSESSSSSSESSDSECDEVIDMKCVKNKVAVQPIETKGIPIVNEEPSLTTPNILQEQSMSKQVSPNSEQKSCNMILELALNKDAGIEVLNSDTVNMNHSDVGGVGKKIEVCMGGKCKKSGAPALMEEFRRVMGSDGVVEGCKCLGKCKSAPNVRVLNDSVGDDSLRTPSNSLCIGVGLEDVELIVGNWFGEVSKDDLRAAVAGVSS